MKILIVDDNAVSRKVMKAMCSRLGYKVVEARNGQEGWEMFKTYPVRIIISDWMMPTMSGVDLCKKVRESQHSDYTFFFLITGKKTSLDDFALARSIGADDFVYKPLDFYVLRNQINMAERMLALINDESDRDHFASLRKALFKPVNPEVEIADVN